MNLSLIEIKQGMPGFDGFFGAWLYQDENLCFLVDSGPANAGRGLISSLKSMGVDRIDFIFLTHIHIDHAGPLADLLDQYPTAKAVCHEKGIPFLVDPSRLWEGSIKVLGEIAKSYGRPKPVKEERLIPHTQANIEDLLIIETPGHAPHHLSYHYKNTLFAGESAGNYFLINGVEYLRPATPPRFFLDVFLNSIERMLALKDQTICYAHCGSAESSHRMLKKLHNQILHWREIIHAQLEQGDNDLTNRCVQALLDKDPNLRAFNEMESKMQQREKIFLANAVDGFVGFIKEEARPS